jgi:hypothetical protein
MLCPRNQFYLLKKQYILVPPPPTLVELCSAVNLYHMFYLVTGSLSGNMADFHLFSTLVCYILHVVFFFLQ